MITFEEDSAFGYKMRTIKNASADATIAIAVDFNTAGEKLTKTSVLAQGKKYIKVDANKSISLELLRKIINDLNSVGAKTLNIAGNGIYTVKGKFTQDDIDDFTYRLLKLVTESPELKNPIENMRSGGQTGFDEAGIKAAVKLGIPVTVLAPRGFKFRNIDGDDIVDKELFMKRFKV